MSGPGAVSRETDPARAALLEAYPGAGPQLDRFAALLSGPALVRGLLGPRELPRLWGRHLANSAVLAELVPVGARVVDVGSGAGLPGLPLALVRPDLTLVLLEPLLRRASFLQEVVTELGLTGRVAVRRERAEDVDGPLAEVATARAVAPLDRLVTWTLPLLPVGGQLLALKGATASAEAAAAGPTVSRLGGGPAEVVRCGAGVVDPPTTVVRIHKERAARARRKGGR
jgi:16S rRNA (guanine527-N7)-methyltransferase